MTIKKLSIFLWVLTTALYAVAQDRLITNENELRAFATSVNDGTYDGQRVCLASDITSREHGFLSVRKKNPSTECSRDGGIPSAD